MRYTFDDVDHYFIKYYGRDLVNPRQSAEQRAADYAALRVECVTQGRGEFRDYTKEHRPERRYDSGQGRDNRNMRGGRPDREADNGSGNGSDITDNQ